MAHEHVVNTGAVFKIDPATRTVTSKEKKRLMQYDHNSKRFGFEMPKEVDGHDMTLCDKVEIYYINIAKDGSMRREDVHTVNDLTSNADKLTFTWLVSGNATQLEGIVIFLIKFSCLTGTEADYIWHTEMCNEIEIGEGMNNAEAIVEIYSDVLEEWRQKLFGASDGTIGEISKKWTGLKWAVVGDSITYTASRASKHYHDYIADATGITVVNMGVSETGYASKADENLAFYQRIFDVPTDSHVVTICGSGNDLNQSVGLEIGEVTDNDASTLCGHINMTIDNLYSFLPTVQLGLITPVPTKGSPPIVKGNNLEMYANKIVELCRYRSIPCLDLYHCSGLRPWETAFNDFAYSRDEGRGIHPDETGHSIIAPRIQAFLETLIVKDYTMLSPTITPPSLQIIMQPKNYIGAIGETATFSVEATGKGLTYQWQYSNNGTTWYNSSAEGNKTAMMSVAIATNRDNQKYRCIVTDANGESVTSSVATLTIG